MGNIPAPSAHITLRSRVNFAVQHLMGAARCSRLVENIEQENQGQPYGPFFDEVLGYSSACVLLSVSGVESFINEMFADRDRHFSDTSKPVLDHLWNAYDRKRLAMKFDLALALLGKGQLDKGSKAYADINALIKLRNGLVHFRPEWFDERSEHERLSSVLAGLFALNPWLPNEGAFPRAWATHTGTVWSVNSAVAFIRAFDTQAGRGDTLAKFAARLIP